jgi:hypothetical protein
MAEVKNVSNGAMLNGNTLYKICYLTVDKIVTICSNAE